MNSNTFYYYVLLFWSLFCFACSGSSTKNIQHHDEIKNRTPDDDLYIENDRVGESQKESVDKVGYSADLGDRFALTYSLENQKAVLSVRASLFEVSEGEVICLPAFGQRYGEKLFLQSVKDGLDSPANIQFNEEGCFESQSHKELKFDYRLELDSLDGSRIWMAQSLSSTSNADWAAYPGESIFLDRAQKQNNVWLSINADTGVYSTLKSMGQNSFGAINYFNLTRSYFLFGRLQTVKTFAHQTEINIHLDQTSVAYGKIIAKEIAALWGYYRSFMHEHAPNRIDIFVFASGHDDNLSEGFARPGGLVLQFGKEGIIQPLERRLLIAHELFHLYNGEQLHFKDVYYHRISWFLEGMTQFIAIRALLSLGLASQSQYREFLSKLVNQKQCTDDNNQCSFKPYVDGYFLSWMLNNKIHAVCASQSVEGLWTQLDSLNGWDEAHSDSWIIQRINNYCYTNFESELNQFIVDFEKIPYKRLLSDSGLCLKQSNVVKYSLGINYKFDSVKSQYRVTQVFPNSVGYTAGIRQGDYFVPQGSINWKNRDSKNLYKFTAGGRNVALKVPVETVVEIQDEVYPCL